MVYPTCLLVSQMKDLDLFDNIPYKYIKNIINEDDEAIDIEIRALQSDFRDDWCKTRFTFELTLGKLNWFDADDTYKKFVVVKEYNGSSPYALTMCQLDEDEDEDEED